MGYLTRSATNYQYKHIGNIRHGVQTAPWRVEFDADVKDEANAQKIYQGSVVSLDSNGKYVAGCTAGTGVNRPVPYIAMLNVADPDVTTGKTGSSAAEKTYSGMGGHITAIPVTCGYELETTEFDTSKTYTPNDGVVVDQNSANVGKLTLATVAPGLSEVYVGFVSVPPANDYLGNSRIAFQANFIPAALALPDYSTTTSAVALKATNGVLSWV